MNTAAVSCNKSLNITYLRLISHQQETQATYLHTVQYISSWVGLIRFDQAIVVGCSN
jgi:hypothetical protein